MPDAVLVTGAAGFIGSHLVDALLARGDYVVGIDNLNSYYDPAIKRSNLAAVEGSATRSDQFTFVSGDVRDRDLVRHVFREHRVRRVAHLAAMAGVRASIEDPGLYVDVNVLGTLSVLDAARDARVENMVLASTSSVYGATDRVPFVETDASDRPLAPYPASKRAAEILAYSYHHLYGLDVTVLRFFTVYGPRNRPDMMAHKVLHSIVRGGEVPLFNGGELYRDWTYVGDIVRGVISALDRPLGYEIINLGRGEPVLLRKFVEILESLAGRRATLTDVKVPPTDVPRTFADIEKARRLLGYDPQVSVGEGARLLWEWYVKGDTLPQTRE